MRYFIISTVAKKAYEKAKVVKGKLNAKLRDQLDR